MDKKGGMEEREEKGGGNPQIKGRESERERERERKRERERERESLEDTRRNKIF